MHKLAPVEDAKTLFREAKDWSMWRWLTDKKKARSTADAAWEALEACEEKVKDNWPAEWREAYRAFSSNGRPKTRPAPVLDPDLQAALARLWDTDLEARQAREAAETQFDEADRRMSVPMARDGTQMAIDAWELREKFIRKAESLNRRK